MAFRFLLTLGLLLTVLALASPVRAGESGFYNDPFRATPANTNADRLNSGRLFRRWPEDVRAQGEFRLQYFSEEEVEKQETDFDLIEYDFRVRIPIFAGTNDELLFTLNYDTMSVDTKAVLPETPDEDFPDSLTDLGFNFTYHRDFYDGWNGGLHCRIASAGDELFGNEATVLSATGYLRIPDMFADNNWLFYLNYANRRTERDMAAFTTSAELDNWPIPGVGYEMEFDQGNWLLLGLPYSALHFEPDEWLMIDVSYKLMREAHAKLTYVVTNRLEFYGAFDWQGRVFFRDAREDEDDRLVVYDKKVAAGVFYRWKENIRFNLELGRSFDRFAYEAEEYDDREDNWFEMTDAMFITFEFKLNF